MSILRRTYLMQAGLLYKFERQGSVAGWVLDSTGTVATPAGFRTGRHVVRQNRKVNLRLVKANLRLVRTTG